VTQRPPGSHSTLPSTAPRTLLGHPACVDRLSDARTPQRGDKELYGPRYTITFYDHPLGSGSRMIIANVDDYRKQCEARLPRFLYDYISGGSYQENTPRFCANA
jgi:hypothetical protein